MTVMIVVLVLGLITVTLSTAIVNTTRTTAGVKGGLQAQAAADAGLAVAYAAAKANPSGVCSLAPASSVAPRYSVTTSCPTGSGQVTFTSIGYGEGTNAGTSKAQATYSFAGSVSTSGPENALVIGGGNFSANALNVLQGSTAVNSAALLLKGDFNSCNNASRFGTDVILYTGSLNLTNTCTFDKDIYVAGNLTITASATVSGSIYVMGDVSITNSTVTVGGNLYAKGNVSLNGKVIGNLVTEKGLKTSGATISGSVTTGGPLDLNATSVGGSLVSASTQPAALYNVKAASVSVAGPIGSSGAYFQSSTVTGDVISAQRSVQSYIAPDTKIGGALRLGGTANTGWGPPTATKGNSYNVTGLVAPGAPTVAVPDPLTPGKSKWQDYGFVASDWAATGYAVDTWPPSGTCDLSQWGPANVARLTGYSVPTVADMRGCGKISGYQANLKFKTDVVVLLSDNGSTHDFQEAQVTSADGQPHRFSIVVPDNTKDSAATCANSGSQISIYAAMLGTAPKMTGLIYTPCKLTFGVAGSKGNWTGQLYAGEMSFGGNGSPGFQFVYEPIGVPGFGSSSGSAPTIGNLISRRAVG
ncbi:hypothetical protein [Microbacterium sp. CJ88]|uniref:hypothetical protein n=1 Tax=Microbacterium sp. CJ88 TaxID=3445672 RepID=UPI003F65BD15